MKLAWYAFISFSVIFSVFTVARILLTFDLLDFSVYHASAGYLLQGRNPYESAPNGMSFIYPPPAVLAISWLAFLPLALAENVWTMLSCVSLLISIYVLIKSYISPVPPLVFLTILSFSLLAFPTRFTLGLGQINLFILLLVSLSMYCSSCKHDSRAGALLAMATLIKVSPLVLLIIFIKNNNKRALTAFALTCVGLSVLSVVVMGQEIVTTYFTTVFPNLPTIGNASYYNQALTGFLARAGVSDGLAQKIHYTTLFGGFGLSAVLIKKHTEPLRDMLTAGLVITLGLITGGLTWQHHLVLLVIPFTALYLQLYYQKKRSVWKMVAVSLAYGLVAYNIKNPQEMPLQPLLLSHGLWGMLLLSALLITTIRQMYGAPLASSEQPADKDHHK